MLKDLEVGRFWHIKEVEGWWGGRGYRNEVMCAWETENVGSTTWIQVLTPPSIS